MLCLVLDKCELASESKNPGQMGIGGHSQKLHRFGSFYHCKPPKWNLEAAIDRLAMQFGIISPLNQLWITSLSMGASKIYFCRLSVIKWSKPV